MKEDEKSKAAQSEKGNVVRLPVTPTPDALIDGLIRTGSEEEKKFWIGLRERAKNVEQLKLGDLFSEFRGATY